MNRISPSRGLSGRGEWELFFAGDQCVYELHKPREICFDERLQTKSDGPNLSDPDRI